MTLAQLLVVLRLDSGPFKAGMVSAMNQIGALQRGFGALTSGAALSSVGRSLTMGLTIPILAAGAAVGVLGSNLASEMARVQSVIASPGDLKSGLIAGWTDDVQRLGVTLGRTSPEVAGGLYEIVSAFGALPNALQFLEIAGRGAVAGQSEIVQSTRNLVLSTRAWGDSSTQAVQRMSDLMSATVRVGTLTESKLGPAMAGLLPIMRLYNVGLNEGFAGLASLAGVSGSASQASTQLQRAITSLVAPNTTLTKLYKQNGIASGEALISQRGLIGAFQEVVRISEQTGVPLQKLMGRIEGVKAVATLTGPQLEAFNDNLTAMGNAAGDVDRAFAGATEGVDRAGFQWAQSMQRLRVIAEDLYVAFAPAALNVGNALAPAGEALERFAQVIAGLDTGTLTNILYSLLGLAALGPVLTIIGSLTTLFGGLSSVLAAANPWVLAVAAAGGALWLAWSNDWGGIQGGVYSLMDGIRQRAENTQGAIKNLQDVWDKFRNPPAATGGTEGPITTLRDVGKAVGDVWKALGPAQGELSKFEQRMIESPRKVQGAWDLFWSGFADNWPDFSGLWSSLTSGAAAAGVGVTTAITPAITGVGQNFGGMATTAISKMNTIPPGAKSTAAATKSAFTTAGWAGVGSSIISGIVGGIKSAASSLASAAAAAAKSALSAAKSALGINSPSRVFRDQVGAMIPAGMALGIYDGMGAVNRAINSLLIGGSGGGINLSIGAHAMQTGLAMAGAGGSTTTNHTDQTINVYVTAAPGATQEDGENVGIGITKALRSRGLA